MEEFKPFTIEVQTREEALVWKTAITLMPSTQLSQILFSRILEGLGELDLSE